MPSFINEVFFMNIFEIKYIFDQLSLILSIILLPTSLLSLKKKTNMEHLKKRNALLSGVFASLGDILGLFAWGQLYFSVVSIFSGISTYFLILSLDVSKKLLKKDTNLDPYLSFGCAYALSFSHLLINPFVDFVNTGEILDIAALFLILLITYLGLHLAEKQAKKEKSWIDMPQKEKRKYYITRELFTLFSFSLGLWASYFLDKIILFFAVILFLKTFSNSIPHRKKTTAVLKLVWKRFEDRKDVIEKNVWLTLTDIRDFSSGFVYGWALVVSSIYVALNLQFVDPENSLQILVMLISFLPAILAYLSIMSRLKENLALPLIVFPWIAVLLCMWLIPHSLPLQNASYQLLSVMYPEWGQNMIHQYALIITFDVSTLLVILPITTIFTNAKFDSALLKKNEIQYRKWVKIHYISVISIITVISSSGFWYAIQILLNYYEAFYGVSLSLNWIIMIWFCFSVLFASLTGLMFFTVYKHRIDSVSELKTNSNTLRR